MKKLGALILFGLFTTLYSFAQDIYVPYVIKEYPIQFKVLQDHKVARVANFTYVVEEPSTYSQFYIKGMKVSDTYSADSLQNYFINTVYKDEEIMNLQLREKGRGSLGEHEADRVVLSFLADDKLYLSTIFLVYFHINDEYNAILFYFEMGEKNVISYEGVLINMAQTLEWLEVPYIKFNNEDYQIQAELPEFWKSESELMNDTTYFISLHDGRGRLNVTVREVKDSLDAKSIATMEHKALKTNPGIYVGHKLKASAGKWINDESVGRWIGSYNEVKGTYKRNMTLNRYYIKRIVGDKLFLYTVDLLCPSYNVDYYQPIFDRMGKSLSLPGNTFIAPKKKK